MGYGPQAVILEYATEPPRILYRGAYLKLSPLQVQIMARLLDGPARAGALHVNVPSLKVVLCGMRKKLPADVRIVAVRGYGYRLAIEATAIR